MDKQKIVDFMRSEGITSFYVPDEMLDCSDDDEKKTCIRLRNTTSNRAVTKVVLHNCISELMHEVNVRDYVMFIKGQKSTMHKSGGGSGSITEYIIDSKTLAGYLTPYLLEKITTKIRSKCVLHMQCLQVTSLKKSTTLETQKPDLLKSIETYVNESARKSLKRRTSQVEPTPPVEPIVEPVKPIATVETAKPIVEYKPITIAPQKKVIKNTFEDFYEAKAKRKAESLMHSNSSVDKPKATTMSSSAADKPKVASTKIESKSKPKKTKRRITKATSYLDLVEEKLPTFLEEMSPSLRTSDGKVTFDAFFKKKAMLNFLESLLTVCS